MDLNKNNSYVLIHILNGNDTAKKISQQMQSVDVRSIQRALARLTDLGLLTRIGTNHPSYRVNHDKLLDLNIADKLLEDENRPKSIFNHELINWLLKLPADKLELLLSSNTNDKLVLKHPEQMTAKELEYLTIELSWKSSALEGNTYTLLDTQLLLLEGIKAKNRTEFETQMILNHKDAVAFIVENKELFGKRIKFRTIEELHKIIGKNLGIATGIRKKLVRITASNYEPLSNPHQLRENGDNILEIINRTPNPYIKALLAFALIPYLQIFEDGNKRTGRMLANAITISFINKGFNLRKTDARKLAIAYLAFYEFNSVHALNKILQTELKSD
ncbi:MAG TPA: Fic family protein [Candidatus Saccharimonadales bacterium]|nr:Fic family protein [Candidatus Saccharimonadales bacterium]